MEYSKLLYVTRRPSEIIEKADIVTQWWRAARHESSDLRGHPSNWAEHMVAESTAVFADIDLTTDVHPRPRQFQTHLGRPH